MSDNHSSSPDQENLNSTYWRSLDELSEKVSPSANASAEVKKVADAEFTQGSLERRDFLKLMGASVALATTSCIRRPVQKIIPYNKQPEEITFAVPNFYTSTYLDGIEPLGLLVKTREGRPLKVDGNPEHPMNQGGLSAKAQAHILSLYDPERMKGPVKNLLNKTRSNFDTVSTSWEDADKAITAQLKKGNVAILTGPVLSPTTQMLINDFCQGFKAKHYAWSPLSIAHLVEAQKVSYGTATLPQYHIEKAQVIVSVDADFLGTYLKPTTFAKQFAVGRRNYKKMNRLISFDSQYSLTGANSDLRYKIKPSEGASVILGLAYEIVVRGAKSSYAANAQVKSYLGNYANVAQEIGVSPELFSRVAQDLWNAKGESLVLVGDTQSDVSFEAQVAANFLNSVLENEGKTIVAGVHSGTASSYGSPSEILQLLADLNAGKISTLVVHGVNPLYTLPESLNAKDAFKKVELLISTADRQDETATLAHYILPDNHVLESWNDLDFGNGVVSLQQPTIRPLYETRSIHLSLMTWAYLGDRGPKRLTTFETYYDYLRNAWKEELYPKLGKGQGFDDFWDEALQKGFVGTPKESSGRSLKLDSLKAGSPAKAVKGLQLHLYPTVQMGDGSLSNVAWLQELPDPVTKIVWDNYASISLKLSETLKVKEGQMVQLKVGSATLEVPVHIQPGLHSEVVALGLGYGRTHAGKVGNGIGFNSYKLAQASKSDKNQFLQLSGISVEVIPTSNFYELASTQSHHVLDSKNDGKRKIVVEATLKEFEENPAANNHKHKIFSIWEGHEYKGHKWAMTVDLNTCTGCSACVIACQSENNIPVVGKKYVLQGREMHWIRVDRYFIGDAETAEAVFQPLMCQQCDNAPCETVCPVLATVHNSEGLNDMVYNRCVGTRYCSNNCPYKVRRFNWFNLTGNIEKPLNLALNPEVTVRSRGVMEKCTFCVHKIKAGKNKAKLEKRDLVDGEIKTSCQSSCPTGAIVFGDLNNPESAVSKIYKEDPRNYALLEEFHAAPTVRYLTKIRNNHEEHRPQSEITHHKKGGHA